MKQTMTHSVARIQLGNIANITDGEAFIKIKFPDGIGEIKTKILIGDDIVEVNTEDLVEAYNEAEDFLDANIDGG
jgi:hypothetical protein